MEKITIKSIVIYVKILEKSSVMMLTVTLETFCVSQVKLDSFEIVTKWC